MIAVPSQLSQAIQSAWEARVALRRMPVAERIARVQACAPILEKHRARLIEAAIESAGCSRKWAVSQVDSCARIARTIGERAVHIRDEEIVLGHTTDHATVVREPFGVVGLVTPSNSPYRPLIAGLAEAIVSGNSIVMKPSSASVVAVAELVAVLADTLGPGVQMTAAPGREVAAAFCSDPRVGVVRLYGNFRTGVEYLRVYSDGLTAALATPSAAGLRRLKSFILELSGNDPLVVLPGADLADAVAATVQGSFLNSGQVCLCAKRIIVHRSVADEFTRRLRDGIATLKLGPLADPDTDIGPLIKASQVKLVMDQVDDAVRRGGRVLCGGGMQGGIIEPTVIAFEPAQVAPPAAADKPLIWSDECFGPVRPLVPYDDPEDAYRLAADTSYGLGATIYGEPTAARELARRLDCGRVAINSNPASHIGQTLPFGGTKDSGLGGATYAIREQTYGKLLVEDRGGG